MNEQLLYSWTFKFCKVVRQHIWGEMAYFIPFFSCSSPQSKIIIKISPHLPKLWQKVWLGAFYESQCRNNRALLTGSCLATCCSSCSVRRVSVATRVNAGPRRQRYVMRNACPAQIFVWRRCHGDSSSSSRSRDIRWLRTKLIDCDDPRPAAASSRSALEALAVSLLSALCSNWAVAAKTRDAAYHLKMISKRRTTLKSCSQVIGGLWG